MYIYMCKFAKKNNSKTLFYLWTGESYGQETLLAPLLTNKLATLTERCC